ncbi:MAG: Cof-type HAD-IIB family hydrolase [Treponemataceae bacterium]|nr:MAG: Cof-type HAD-IIB family hydrolase [Treponemataceae bacterium]
MKLAPKIIALDLDDTLLTAALSISDYTRSVLHECEKKGIYITLCSGRARNAMLPYAYQLGVDLSDRGRYLITQNGGIIRDMQLAEEIYRVNIDGNLLNAIFAAAQKRGLSSQVYDAAYIYTNEDNRWTQIDSRLSGLSLRVVKDFPEFVSGGFPKMVIPGEPAKLQELKAELDAVFGDKAVFFISKPYFLEAMRKDCGKGEALKWLANCRHIPQAEVMAFGDSMNDETMLQYAGMSVAMINGMTEIKAISKYVTERTNNNDGVAHFLETHVL